MTYTPLKTRTTDAFTSFLYDLMRDYVPAGTVEKIVFECERHSQGAAILDGPLGPYVVEITRRLRAASVEMRKSDILGTEDCPVGPPGISGPSDDMGASYGGVQEYHGPERPPGVVRVAADDGVSYTTKVGDPSHDTPEARARGLLAHECKESGLPLSRVVKLRKELNDYTQRWITSPLQKSAKDHAEFELMNTAGLFMGIEDYLRHPSRVKAATLHARSAPFLARLGKDSLLIEG